MKNKPNTNSYSLNEARSNFDSLVEKTNQNGTVKIMVDGQLKFALIDLDKTNFLEDLTEDEVFDIVSKRVFKKYRTAFEELAK